MGGGTVTYKKESHGGAVASCRGTAYVEYFILAAAMAGAAVWLWDNGNYRGAVANLQGTFDGQMSNIKGNVAVP